MRIKLAAFFLIFMVLTAMVQHDFDANTNYFSHREMFAAIPSGKTLKVISFGFENLVADMLFIWAIQLYSTYNLSNSFDYIEHIFNSITDLTPEYIYPYSIGALIMGPEGGDFKMAIRLLQKGAAKLKDIWLFDYVSGYYAYRFLKDLELAEKYYAKAAANPNAPPLVKRLRGHMIYMKDDLERAFQFWTAIAKNAKTIIEKDSAANHLYQIKAEMDLKILRQKIRVFKQKFSRYPANLAELVGKRFIRQVPRDYRGHNYIYDVSTGKIKANRIFKWKSIF